MAATYDTIGINYAALRRADPRIAKTITDELGDAKNILNVGAGTGSYEPTDRKVTALEPSAEMIRQRGVSSATVVHGHAEDLPFDDDSFDASMAVMTVHHWSDRQKGLAEMRRVTRGPVVLLTFDPSHPGSWLTDYIPQLKTLDDGQMPTMAEYETWLGPVTISPVPLPHDCTDGMIYAYWRRPRAYLDPGIRAAMSSFWAIGDVTAELGKLERDIETGAWAEKYSALLGAEEFDAGYRLVISG